MSYSQFDDVLLFPAELYIPVGLALVETARYASDRVSGDNCSESRNFPMSASGHARTHALSK